MREILYLLGFVIGGCHFNSIRLADDSVLMADSEVVLNNVTKYLKKEFLTEHKQCIIVSKTDSNGVNYKVVTLE